MSEHNHEYGRTHCNVCTAERMRAYRARRKAGESKTVPRLDWRADDIDPVVVDRAIHGRDVGRPLHPRERREIARRLRGTGVNTLMKVLGCSSVTARELMEER